MSGNAAIVAIFCFLVVAFLFWWPLFVYSWQYWFG